MLGPFLRLADLARDWGRRRTMNPDLARGRRGEDIAHRFLQRNGMTVVARNHRTPSGSAEVDLIAWDAETLVFVEVKSRSSTEYGPPERAIDQQKCEKLARVAIDYAGRAGIPFDRIRFDVVTVLFSSPPQLSHYRDVFTIRSIANTN